ncbi:hypothetical protein BHE74_00029577 [Ensete ventricosum]|nr:hypothetical protein BHE74_00029577 [Ensete ventricosum]
MHLRVSSTLAASQTFTQDPPERPKGRKAKSMAGGITQLWRASGETCPQGTVPIRRTTEVEALRVRKYWADGPILVEGAGESPFPNHEVSVGQMAQVQPIMGFSEAHSPEPYLY